MPNINVLVRPSICCRPEVSLFSLHHYEPISSSNVPLCVWSRQTPLCRSMDSTFNWSFFWGRWWDCPWDLCQTPVVVAGKLAASAIKHVVTLEQVVAEWQLAPREKTKQVARVEEWSLHWHWPRGKCILISMRDNTSARLSPHSLAPPQVQQ
jgi:hypothetical protein